MSRSEYSVQNDSNKVKDLCFARKVSYVQLGKQIGRSNSYVGNCLASGRMSKAELILASQILQVPYDDLLYKEPPKPEPKPVLIPIPGYTTNLIVRPKKVCFSILFDGKEVCKAWATIRGARELDLIQSISYAAHQCYKIIEQKCLEEKEN